MYHLGQLGYFSLKLNLQFLKSVMIWKSEMQNLHLTKIQQATLPLGTRIMWTWHKDHENKAVPDGAEEKFAATPALGAVFCGKVI